MHLRKLESVFPVHAQCCLRAPLGIPSDFFKKRFGHEQEDTKRDVSVFARWQFTIRHQLRITSRASAWPNAKTSTIATARLIFPVDDYTLCETAVSPCYLNLVSIRNHFEHDGCNRIST